MARDYAAEYQARKARSQAEYGVSYSVQRRLTEKARDSGIKVTEVKDTLSRNKGKADQIEKLIESKAARKEAFESGGGIPDFDYDDYPDVDFGDDDRWGFYHSE